MNFTIKHDGKTYRNFSEEGLRNVGVPDNIVDEFVLGEKLKMIKSECGRRIYAVASKESQSNVSTKLGLIALKSASSRTDEEKAIVDGAEKGIQWVNDMKAAMPALLANGEDYTADAAWPQIPEEAAQVYSQF